MQKLSPQQIGTYALSVFTFCVTQVVAFVPTLGNEKQILISAGGAVISAGVTIAGAVHDLASSHKPATATAAPIAAKSPPVTPEEKLRSQLLAAGIEPSA